MPNATSKCIGSTSAARRGGGGGRVSTGSLNATKCPALETGTSVVSFRVSQSLNHEEWTAKTTATPQNVLGGSNTMILGRGAIIWAAQNCIELLLVNINSSERFSITFIVDSHIASGLWHSSRTSPRPRGRSPSISTNCDNLLRIRVKLVLAFAFSCLNAVHLRFSVHLYTEFNMLILVLRFSLPKGSALALVCTS